MQDELPDDLPEDLDELDDSALDALPHGVVCLSEARTVVRMNRTESERSGIQRWRAIGRDFFADVAPGPSNGALADRVRSFMAGKGPSRPFPHTFRRRAGADETTIELLRGHRADRIYLCIRRSA